MIAAAANRAPADVLFALISGTTGYTKERISARCFLLFSLGSESRFHACHRIAIPRGSIYQASREFRFTNGASTDDHVVHCVGYEKSAPDTWFLVKGYFFYPADYLKLKVLTFMTHKDAMAGLLAKFQASN